MVELLLAAAVLGQVAGPAQQQAGRVPDAQVLTPNTELCRALEVALRQNAHHRRQIRFLSFYNLPREQWDSAYTAVSFAINTLSRHSAIKRPYRVNGYPSLVAVMWVDDYGLPLEGWEELVGKDPYWHLTTQVRPPGKRDVETVVTDGGWLDLYAAQALREVTGSAGAVLRADFFLARTMTTLEGGSYYRLAGIPPKEADFFKLAGVDLKALKEFVGVAEVGANIYVSDVTHNPRRVVRWQAPAGAFWKTFDSDQATPDQDPFQNPFDFRFIAGEHIAAKPNGLHWFGLYNAAGERQDTAPDTLAKDHKDLMGNGILAPGVSCIRCHGEGGLLPVRNDQKRLLDGPADVLLADPKARDRMRAFYDSPRANVFITRDMEDYELSVRAATGKGAAEAGALLAGLFDRYLYELVTPRMAADELGIVPEEFGLRMQGARGPTVLALLTGISVRRKQWESAFAEAAILAHGGKPRVAARNPKPGVSP